MIPRLVLGSSICGAAIGFAFGIYYAHASHRRMENEFAACRTLAQMELLRGEVQQVLRYIKP